MSAIADLDPRRDLNLIRERIEQQLNRGEDLGPTMHDLADRNPIALADMVIGPRAPSAIPWIRCALDSVDILEEAVAPNGLYRQLVKLCPTLQHEILAVAARRHPAASWLVELSRAVEGQTAGITHLRASIAHPSFTQNCWAHAAAGHLPGLIAFAEQTGKAEPAAALAAHHQLQASAVALLRALEHSADAPVIPLVAAAWGPDIRPILRMTLPHLRSKQVAMSLHRHCQGYADFSTLLETIIRAMVKR